MRHKLILTIALALLTLLPPALGSGKVDAEVWSALGSSSSPPPPCSARVTASGDYVAMNGPGTLTVTAPCNGGQWSNTNPSTCCGTTTTSIPGGVYAAGNWLVETSFNCCGGYPRFWIDVAGYSVATGFICHGGAHPTLWFNPYARAWGIVSC